MPGHRRSGWRLAVSVVLAAVLTTVPLEWFHPHAVAFDGCTLTDEVRGTTCALKDGESVEGSFDGPRGSATYRIDAFSPDTTLELVLVGQGGPMVVSVLDWRGETVAMTARRTEDSEVRLSARLPVPGAYGVRVSGEASLVSSGYRLTARLRESGPAAMPVWPPALVSGDGPLSDERRLIRVPRGGTPAGGVAAGRILGAPPQAIFADFALVADVRFEQIVGPSALSIRFRYEPEAGGGTGYLFSLNPFAGTASLDVFEEGQRHSIVADVPLPAQPTSDAPNRLVLTADGPTISVTLDGKVLLETIDSRYQRGLIAVGAVTWSDPVAVTFDHIQVSSPRR